MRNHILVTLGILLSFLYFLFFSNTLAEQKQELVKSSTNQVTELENQIELLTSQVSDYENTLYGVGGASSIPENLTTGDFVFPIAEEDFLRYSSPYGLRRSPFTNILTQHEGVDIATVWRAQVVSVSDGVVTEHWPPPGAVINGTVFRGHPVYGGVLRIRHDNGLETLYAHMSETFVNQNDIVSAGEVIGRVGNTGISTGQHLHFEIFINGDTVNPMVYLSELPEFEQN